MKNIDEYFVFEKETKTIRLMPYNYWVASVINNKVAFDSFDGMTKKLFDDGLITQKEVIDYYGQKIEINSKQVRRILKLFFEDSSTGVLYTITNINVFKGHEHIIVEITTHRPGLIIGKGGRTIDALTERLTKELETPVKIELTEDQMWYDLFD